MDYTNQSKAIKISDFKKAEEFLKKTDNFDLLSIREGIGGLLSEANNSAVIDLSTLFNLIMQKNTVCIQKRNL